MGCGASAAAPAEKYEAKAAAPVKKESAAMKFLATVPIFKKLEEVDMRAISEKMRPKVFAPGEVIFRQGDEGSEFFILVDGTAEVTVTKEGEDTIKIPLGKGDFFGERAILMSQTRAATITAKTELKTVFLTAETFAELNLREKVNFGQRQAVGAEKVEVYAAVALVKIEKPQEMHDLIMNAVKNEATIDGVIDTTEKMLKTCAEVAKPISVKAGQQIIQYGDSVADQYYILAKGSVDVTVPAAAAGGGGEDGRASISQKEEGGDEVKMKTIGLFSAPWTFGAVALLYGTPRTAGVAALEDCDLYTISRSAFKQILMEGSANELDEYITFMDKVETLAGLDKDNKKALAQALTECSFGQGETVMTEGEEGDCMYLVQSGDLDVFKGEDKVHSYTVGGYFGDKALLNHEKRTATVKVASAHADLLKIDKASFDLVQRSMAAAASGKTLAQMAAAEGGTQMAGYGVIQRADLTKLGFLGAGGFGFVSLEKDKKNEYYALKGLSKGHLVATGMKESAIAEKDILCMLDSKYIVKLFNTYKDEQNLYFLLEACLAGDLYLVLNSKNLYGKPDCAAYYSAVVIESFAYLHSLRIVYRDLKPENLLMTHDGVAKLCDMGISKVIVGKTYTMCGTPEYFSPEVIKQKGHDFMVDWWALGIFIYELLAGETPFADSSTLKIYRGINKGIDKIKINKKVQPYLDLVKGLCQLKPSDRWPSKQGGLDRVRKSELFANTNWEELNTPGMKTPYSPKINPEKVNLKGRVDMADVKSLQLPYKDDGSGWDKEF